MTPPERWDLVVVGAGPAGAAAALGALRARPELSVLLLDRAAFPRDKVCGDGIAPHAMDLLADAGVHGLVDDWTPVSRLRLRRGDNEAVGTMRRAALVVPRKVFDARLVEAACAVGAVLRQQRVRTVVASTDGVKVDGLVAGSVVGADGAHSVVRAAAGLPKGRMALAIRGYAPPAPNRVGEQQIVFGGAAGLSYAWSFDRGDGLANVGYGEVLKPWRRPSNRGTLLHRLETLLPGSTTGGSHWRGHHLPLSSWTWPHPDGRVLLAGDAAGLVNPLTGEGIYYAVATGLAAGRSAAVAVAGGDAQRAGREYRHVTRRLLARHLRHTSLAARLSRRGPVLDAGIRAAASDSRVFDDLVEIGLGRGLITPAIGLGLARHARAVSGTGTRV
jgi:geranylgeranyl reductase family protein